MSQNQFINLHVLQAVPASLLNRDDTGSAKGITFGNVRRDRVSSQSWKRSERLAYRSLLADTEVIANGDFGVRTNRLPREVIDQLVTRGHDRNIAEAKTLQAFKAAGLSTADGKPQTAVQLYVSSKASAAISEVLNAHFDDIGDAVPADVTAGLLTSLDPGRAVDIALFGRFISELKSKKRVDGAVGVSHPIGVTPATVEQDFWTAVDDVQSDTDSASSNLGTADLTAPVFYRHAFLDRCQLAANLANTSIDPQEVEQQYLRIAAVSAPTAKQNSTAAHTLPSLLVATVSSGNYSGAAAFTSPITSTTVLEDATSALLGNLDSHSRLGVSQDIFVLPLSPETEHATHLCGDSFTVVSDIDALISAVSATAKE